MPVCVRVLEPTCTVTVTLHGRLFHVLQQLHEALPGPPRPARAAAQVTQLGHVKDLATAFAKILGNAKAARQVYNISGERFVTFDGIARACAEAAGAPEPEIIHFNAKEFDFDGKKPFPLRDQHFFTSIDKARPASMLHYASLLGARKGQRP